MLQKIKPLRTFAAGKQIYYPYKDFYTVDAEQAKSWEESGHCEIIKEPQENEKDLANTNTPEKDDKPLEGENESLDYDSMSHVELKEEAKKQGIKKYNTMKKDKLIAALKGE